MYRGHTRIITSNRARVELWQISGTRNHHDRTPVFDVVVVIEGKPLARGSVLLARYD